MKIISLRHSFIFHSRRFFPNYFSWMLWIFQRFQNHFSPDTDIVSSPSNPLLEVFSFFLDFVKTLHLEEFQKIRSFRSTPPWSNFHSKNPSANFVPNSSHYIRTSRHTLPDYLQPFFHIAFSVLFYRLLLATPVLCTRARLYPLFPCTSQISLCARKARESSVFIRKGTSKSFRRCTRVAISR